MNSITICGQLGKDSEVKFLQSGDAICNFSIADSQGKDKPTIWWNCALFGKRGESLSKYLLKGQSVTVIGSVSEREWVDKDGNKRKQFDVRVNEVALQGGKKEPSQGNQPAQRQNEQSSNFDDLEIPF
jgi:single-strand DNA-binding protein